MRLGIEDFYNLLGAPKFFVGVFLPSALKPVAGRYSHQ